MTTPTVSLALGPDGELLWGRTIMMKADQVARLRKLMHRGDERSPDESAELKALNRTLEDAVAAAEALARIAMDTAFVVE
jgi:hypothetical protein